MNAETPTAAAMAMGTWPEVGKEAADWRGSRELDSSGESPPALEGRARRFPLELGMPAQGGRPPPKTDVDQQVQPASAGSTVGSHTAVAANFSCPRWSVGRPDLESNGGGASGHAYARGDGGSCNPRGLASLLDPSHPAPLIQF